MTLSTVSGAAVRTAAISARIPAVSPRSLAPTSITMSISTAPAAAANDASCALTTEKCFPDGNPTTEVTACGLCRAWTAAATSVGDTQTANTPSSAASAANAVTSCSVASGLSRV